MKKLLLFVVLVWLGMPLFVEGQGLAVRFCDVADPDTTNSTRLNLTQTGDTTSRPICVDLINNTTEELTYNLNFVDGTLSDRGSIVCLGEQEKDSFGQYVGAYESPVTVPPREVVRLTPDVSFPPHVVGERYGCVTYYKWEEPSDDDSGGGMGTIVRTAHTIKVDVERPAVSDLSIQEFPLSGEEVSLMPAGEVSLTQQDSQTVVSFALVNSGNLPQQIAGEVKIGSLFGKTYELPIDTERVAPGELVHIVREFADLSTESKISLLEVDLTYQPIGDQIEIDIPAKMQQQQDIHIFKVIWGFSTWLSVMTLLVLLVLIGLVRWWLHQKKVDREIKELKGQKRG